jgi:fructokinase
VQPILIVGVGELLWDMLPTGRRLGGAPANFAFHAQQLGQPAAIVSRVGDDALGRDLRAELGRLALREDYIQTDPRHPTGTVTVRLDGNANPSYQIAEDVAWDYLVWTDQLHQLAGCVHAVGIGTLAQRSPMARQTIQRLICTAQQAIRVCDANLRPPFYSAELIEATLHWCNWLKLNTEELQVFAGLFGLTGSDTERLARLRARFDLELVCVTHGDKGCLLQTERDELRVMGTIVPVVDTVGAGDAFTAALVARTLEGKPWPQTVRFATRYAAEVCKYAGAMPVIPPARLAELAD